MTKRFFTALAVLVIGSAACVSIADAAERENGARLNGVTVNGLTANGVALNALTPNEPYATGIDLRRAAAQALAKKPEGLAALSSL